MRKQPVKEELIKLQRYIKRFCPEVSHKKFSTEISSDLSGLEESKLIRKYLDNIRQLSVEDDWIN